MESYYPGFETPSEEPPDKTGVFDGIRYEERYGMLSAPQASWRSFLPQLLTEFSGCS